LVDKVEIPFRRLIIRPGAIGDFIVSLPAMEHLRAPYTEVWTNEANLPLAGSFDASRSIISAGLDRYGVLPLERLRSFDSIISWYGTGRPDFRELVEDAGLPFTFFPALPAKESQIHAVDYYAGQVGAPAGMMPEIRVDDFERHGQIVLHPFASNPTKRWPGAMAFDLPGERVVRIRGPEECLDGALFIPDLMELARFLAGAKAYIGNDSGITHLAAALGIPTIALFGPTDPAVWGPRGKRVRILNEPNLEIRPEAVIGALREFGV
jgi:hypothetical protein